MRRAAVVAPTSRGRRVLAEVADSGAFEPDPARSEPTSTSETTARDALADLTTPVDGTAGEAPVAPVLSLEPVDPVDLAATGQLDLLLGEASLEARQSSAMHPGRCVVVPGWVRESDVALLRSVVEPHGGAVADLAGQRGMVPPTAHVDSPTRNAFRPLVTTYATVPYRDIDPTLFAAFAYLAMFGMMFGDVAHGLAIVIFGLAARWWTGTGSAGAARIAPFLVGAGAAAMLFGLLYGEAFGPTGLVPTLWVRPLDEPEQLLVVGLLAGGVLLAITFALSIVNRWREGGPGLALYDPSGIPGALLLAAVGAAGAAVWTSRSTWWVAALVVGLVGAILVFTGLFVRAGSRVTGLPEAVIELFDTLLRLGSNVVSFTRLAAFGLTHAVITEVVWDGTVGLWDRSSLLAAGAAIVLFAVGNVVAFALGALVAAIQALRLEYYELFSRLFTSSGRPFAPWHVPLRRSETS
jgi:V/A-type H+-transporting ATPase subunit I